MLKLQASGKVKERGRPKKTKMFTPQGGTVICKIYVHNQKEKR